MCGSDGGRRASKPLCSRRVSVPLRWRAARPAHRPSRRDFEKGEKGFGYARVNAVARLHRIRAGQTMGLTLDAMRVIFFDNGDCSTERTLVESKARLAEGQTLLTSLKSQRDDLNQLKPRLQHSLATNEPPACAATATTSKAPVN